MSEWAPMTREEFENWINNPSIVLEQLFKEFPKQLFQKLDDSETSLDLLEEWLLERYQKPDEMLAQDQIPLLNGAAYYVGKVFLDRIGGCWDIELNDSNFIFYGIPFITGDWSESSPPICPATLVTSSIDRRTGKCLRTVLNNMIEARSSGK